MSALAADARKRPEAVTLALAVAAAVAFGVACGIWINSRLTPRPPAGAPRPARTQTDARATVSPAPAAQPSPCVGCDTAAAGEATAARGPADSADEARPKKDAGTPTDVTRAAGPDPRPTPGRPEEPAAVGSRPRHTTGPEGVAATSPDPSRPVAWQVGPVPRARARGNFEGGAAQSGARAAGRGGQSPQGPCPLYASASSLSLRTGGVAPLILGGPGAGVRINVSTPDWAELAVIYEGPAAGHNGWLRYSVRSVGRRPGLYTVRFSTPCGSQTIPVTVR